MIFHRRMTPKRSCSEGTEEQCQGPRCDMPDFDSWTHQMDSADVKAIKDGHGMPINQRLADNILDRFWTIFLFWNFDQIFNFQ